MTKEVEFAIDDNVVLIESKDSDYVIQGVVFEIGGTITKWEGEGENRPVQTVAFHYEDEDGEEQVRVAVQYELEMADG